MYDIDHGFSATGIGLTVAGTLETLGYNGWLGHDMQPRAADSTADAVERVVMSILSYEACATVANREEFSPQALQQATIANGMLGRERLLTKRASEAAKLFDQLYEQSLS